MVALICFHIMIIVFSENSLSLKICGFMSLFIFFKKFYPFKLQKKCKTSHFERFDQTLFKKLF